MKTVEELPKGIHRSYTLPDTDLSALWDSIILDDATKSRLLSQAIVNFTVRPKVPRNVLPLHGAVLLVGPPGTGKTSLARGLASKTAECLGGKKFRLLEVDPHVLGSAMMGKTQKAVTELFSQSVAEAASLGPTIVLLDEVETLAADRSRLSFDANPVDVHRATDAVLVQLDLLAETHTNLLFVATSNFSQAVDQAFSSRCDLVLEVPLPGKEACAEILTDCLRGLGAVFNPIGTLAQARDFSMLVDAVVGLDGRAIRKAVASALTVRKEVAASPAKLTMSDLIEAARHASATKMKAQVAS